MTAIHAPHIFINKYLEEKIGRVFSETMPFVPTMPTDIDSFTQTIPQRLDADGNPMPFEGGIAVFDRMFKMRRKPFPHIKCEQVLYYFYRTSDGIQRLYETQQLIQDLLDRGDESAQELNSWIRGLWLQQPEDSRYTDGVNLVTGLSEMRETITIAGDKFLLPYFHEIKIFQLEETRDIVDFGTARTWAGNKIIIDYEWHSS